MRDIFEDNSRRMVVKGVDGSDMLLEGVDYSMTVTKQHEGGFKPTTFTVNTGYKDEVARLLKLAGLEDGASQDQDPEMDMEPAPDMGATGEPLMPSDGIGMEPGMDMEPNMDVPMETKQRKVGGDPMMDLEMPTDFAEAKRLAGIKIVEAKVCDDCECAPCECPEEVVEAVRTDADHMALMQELLSYGEDLLDEGAIDKIAARAARRKARAAHGDPRARIATRSEARPGAIDKVAEKAKSRKDSDDIDLMAADEDPTDNYTDMSQDPSAQVGAPEQEVGAPTQAGGRPEFTADTYSSASADRDAARSIPVAGQQDRYTVGIEDSAEEVPGAAPAHTPAPAAQQPGATGNVGDGEFSEFCRINGLTKNSTLADLQQALAGNQIDTKNLFTLFKQLPDADEPLTDDAVIDGSEEDMFDGHQIGQETGYTPAMQEDDDCMTVESVDSYIDQIDARMAKLMAAFTAAR